MTTLEPGVTPCRSAGALRLRCAERPRKAGRGGGGEPWQTQSSARRAALSLVFGRCPRCQTQTGNDGELPIAKVLQLAADPAPSKLPLR